MTDRLSLANALAEAKIDRPAAERIATEILDAIHDNVATKSDLLAVRTELKADIAAVKADIAAVKSELKGDIAAVRAELKGDISAVKADLREAELRLKTEIDRVVIRLGALVLALTGVILAAIRYLPPAH
jgi:hypothetical protein